MAKGRMAQIMSQGNCLGQVFIQGESARNCPADRSYFDRMSQPGPQMIAGAIQENLRLIFQSPKRARVDDARPVPLKFGPERVARLGVLPPSGFAGFLSERR